MAQRFGSSVNDRPSVGNSKTPYANLNDGDNSSAPLQASNVAGSNPGAPPPKKSEHDVELTQSSAALFETSPVDEEGLTEQEVQDRRAQFGWNELPEKNVNKWFELAKAFWGPMPILIWIAIIVELAVAIWKSVEGRKGAIGHDDFQILCNLLQLRFKSADTSTWIVS